MVGYFYLAKTGYLYLATRGYFFMATDSQRGLRTTAPAQEGELPPIVVVLRRCKQGEQIEIGNVTTPS